jgi:hypothetical protein
MMKYAKYVVGVLFILWMAAITYFTVVNKMNIDVLANFTVEFYQQFMQFVQYVVSQRTI